MLPPSAMPLLFPIYPPHPTATSLPKLMIRFLVGWERVVQGSTLSTKCLTATSLSISAGFWATSQRIGTYVILHALEWCISHSLSCTFGSITLLSYSLSVLKTLSAPLPYHPSPSPHLISPQFFIRPKVSQGIPGHSSLRSNDLADTLVKVGPSLVPSTKPLSLSAFPPNVYISTPVGDAVSNLVSSNIKSLQCLLRSLLSLGLLVVLSFSIMLQRAQHSSWYISPQGWLSQDFFWQQLQF